MSTRNKLILLVFSSLLVLAIGAAGLILHTSERTMLAQQAENSKNSVSLAVRNVVREYDILFNSKAAQAQTLRQSLLSISSTLVGFADMWEDTFAFLQKFPLPEGITMYVLDADGNQLFTRGALLTFSPYTLRDIKDQPVLATTMRLAKSQLPATCLVRVPSVLGDKRLYGRNVFLQDKGLLVGLWQDISLLDQRQANVRAENIEMLRRHFATISIGPSGVLFAVNEDGVTVIGPDGLRRNMNTPGPNGLTLFESLQKAAQTPDTPLEAMSSALFINGEDREVMLYLKTVKEFGWIVGGISYVDEARAPGRELSITLVLGVLATMLVILPIAVWFLAKMTSPLSALANHARQIPDQDFLEAARSLPVLESLANQSTTEIAELAKSFLFMDSTLRARVRELMESTSLKERLQGELAAATEIQNGFLPNSKLDTESRGRFSLLASLVPARAVGGDLYDYFMLDDDTLCFVIGDVSDKGVPAALFMSMTLSLIRSSAHKTASPNALMEVVNKNLSKDNAKCMFVTLFIGMLHLPTGAMRYANGGHNPPLLLRGNEPAMWLETQMEPPVGVFEELTYTQLDMQLLPGDTLFLYTDGLNEAMDAHTAIYGNERMVQALESARLHSDRTILTHMLHEVALHVGDTPPSDDMTILCVHYHSKTSEPQC